MAMDEQLLIQQLRLLNESGLHKSVEIISAFLSSEDGNTTNSVEVLLQFGNSLMARGEYKRALYYFKKGIQNIKVLSSAPNPSSAKTAARTNLLVELRYKAAQCRIHLKEYENAIHELKAIPAASRTVAINLCLAKLSHQLSHKKVAILCYKEVLKQNMYAVEAILALIELGHSVQEILALYPNIPAAIKWLQPVIKAFGSERSYEFKKAIATLSQLEKQYSGNMFILQSIARCYTQIGDSEKAQFFFEKIRSVDRYSMDLMDMYGSTLKLQSNGMELNKLCQELMNINNNRPEPWTCVALYAELKGQKDKALALVERALAIDDRHIPALLTKGSLLLNSGLSEEAVLTYNKACGPYHELSAYQGIVKAYLAMTNYTQAFISAKEAYTLMPNSPRAITLYATVMSHYPETRKQSLSFFKTVFQLEPHCVDAVLALSQLYVWESQLPKAVDLLKNQLQHNNKDVLHVRLGEVLSLMKENAEAMQHFHTALRLNPHCELARQGIERIEKQTSEHNTTNNSTTSAQDVDLLEPELNDEITPDSLDTTS